MGGYSCKTQGLPTRRARGSKAEEAANDPIMAETSICLAEIALFSPARGSSFIAYLSGDFVDHLLREEPSHLMTIYCADNGG
jgi:hypothetical protein